MVVSFRVRTAYDGGWSWPVVVSGEVERRKRVMEENMRDITT